MLTNWTPIVRPPIDGEIVDQKTIGRSLVALQQRTEFLYERLNDFSAQNGKLVIQNAKLGPSVTVGDWVYYNTSSSKYEKAIANKATFIAVSKFDVALYQKEFNAKRISFLPVFIEHQKVQTTITNGSYCLYHGNLSINENVKAVNWLLKNVFNTLQIPFQVVSRNASDSTISYQDVTEELVKKSQLIISKNIIFEEKKFLENLEVLESEP